MGGVKVMAEKFVNLHQRRLVLIETMGNLDEEKRRLKARMSSATDEAKRRIGNEIEELQQQREAARLELAEINQAIKASKAVKHRGGADVSVSQLFVELARRHLEKEDFDYLYQQSLQAANCANDL
ncbi:hypothetical protein SAMN04487868_11622 [Marinobacter salarius]|uniref:Uncharacterized protein n=2 Tax=Marinobacteraceae TaxID=2887365 RepID=A0ABY1FRI6_9GAMM|nr:MAG: hypothetical protein AXW11_14355 [Marinobacter sp. Hex_13]SFL93508.1 hypothetical protein SAMN04487868_11622 [Marinobacter salarius]